MRASLLFLATVALSACDQGNNAASSAVADGAPKFSMPLPSADAS